MLDSVPHTSLMAAFVAGLLSFISPCVLPLVPSYLMYITGLSLDQLFDAVKRRRLRQTIVVNSLMFITGFSLVFIAWSLGQPNRSVPNGPSATHSQVRWSLHHSVWAVCHGDSKSRIS